MDIIEFFSKFNHKKLTEYLVEYCHLYTKPLKIWKSVIINRSAANEIIVLHLIYYSLIIILLVSAKLSSISLYSIPLFVLGEAVMTVIPLTIFIVPFMTLKRIYNKRIKWDALFRLLLIIKLQFLPIVLFTLVIAKDLKIEILYIVAHNLIWIIIVMYLIILPMLLNLKWHQRVIWIICNYMAMSIFIIGISLVALRIKDIHPILKISSIPGPITEFNDLTENYNYAEKLIDDHYLLYTTKHTKERGQYGYRFQYATKLLTFYLSNNKTNDSLSREYSKSNNLTAIDKAKIKKSILESYIPDKYTLTPEKSDSLWHSFTKEFNQDFELAKVNKDSADYESNRKYFQYLFDYFAAYSKPYYDAENAASICKGKPTFVVIGENEYAFLYERKDSHLQDLKRRFVDYEEYIDRRELYSSGLIVILFYPISLIPDKLLVPKTRA